MALLREMLVERLAVGWSQDSQIPQPLQPPDLEL